MDEGENRHRNLGTPRRSAEEEDEGQGLGPDELHKVRDSAGVLIGGKGVGMADGRWQMAGVLLCQKVCCWGREKGRESG